MALFFFSFRSGGARAAACAVATYMMYWLAREGRAREDVGCCCGNHLLLRLHRRGRLRAAARRSSSRRRRPSSPPWSRPAAPAAAAAGGGCCSAHVCVSLPAFSHILKQTPPIARNFFWRLLGEGGATSPAPAAADCCPSRGRAARRCRAAARCRQKFRVRGLRRDVGEWGEGGMWESPAEQQRGAGRQTVRSFGCGASAGMWENGARAECGNHLQSAMPSGVSKRAAEPRPSANPACRLPATVLRPPVLLISRA